jgi:hypothetical protein
MSRRVLCCLFINNYSANKVQNTTVTLITKEETTNNIIGYPNLGPNITDKRNSMYVKCYKCGETDWTNVYPSRSHFTDSVFKWTAIALLSASSFSEDYPGVAIFAAPLVYLIPWLYASIHRCKSCEAFIAKLH